MTAVYFFSEPISDGKRAEIINSGDLIVFNDIKKMRDICEYVRIKFAKALEPVDPVFAHERMSKDKYLEIVSDTQVTLSNDAYLIGLYKGLLEYIGVNLDANLWGKRVNYRVQPPSNSHKGRATASLGPHRDSWYGGVYGQQNWWAPIYELSAGQELSIFPYYWRHPVKSNANDFDLNNFRSIQNSAGDDYQKIFEAAPTAKEILPSEKDLQIILKPGDLLVFSGAHLHNGNRASQGPARFSCDFRTLYLSDVRSGKRLNDTHGNSDGQGLYDFSRISDGRHVSEI